jgi:hypothetical protein
MTSMKKNNLLIIKIISFLLIVITFQLVMIDAKAQYDGIHEDIAKHRKGTISLKQNQVTRWRWFN